MVALRRLVSNLKPDVIFLLETMSEGEELVKGLNGFLNGWEFGL